MRTVVEAPVIIPPGQAAARLGILVSDLVAMIRRRRYDFTEIKAGGKPGDRGRNRWGLTEAQLAAIVRGQAMTPPDTEPKEGEDPQAPLLSPDGVSRLRKSQGRRRM